MKNIPLNNFHSNYHCRLEEFEQFHNEVNSTDVSQHLSLALLEKINFEVGRDFKRCKNDFIEVMETAFPDSDFQKVMLVS